MSTYYICMGRKWCGAGPLISERERGPHAKPEQGTCLHSKRSDSGSLSVMESRQIQQTRDDVLRPRILSTNSVRLPDDALLALPDALSRRWWPVTVYRETKAFICLSNLPRLRGTGSHLALWLSRQLVVLRSCFNHGSYLIRLWSTQVQHIQARESPTAILPVQTLVPHTKLN